MNARTFAIVACALALLSVTAPALAGLGDLAAFEPPEYDGNYIGPLSKRYKPSTISPVIPLLLVLGAAVMGYAFRWARVFLAIWLVPTAALYALWGDKAALFWAALGLWPSVILAVRWLRRHPTPPKNGEDT